MRETKSMYINDIKEAFEAHKPLEQELMRLIDAKIANAGNYYIFSLSYSYDWKWFYGMLDNDKHCKMYGTGRQQTTLWHYRHHLNNFKELTEKLKQFLSNHYQLGYRQWHLDNDNSEQWQKIREEIAARN